MLVWLLVFKQHAIIDNLDLFYPIKFKKRRRSTTTTYPPPAMLSCHPFPRDLTNIDIWPTAVIYTWPQVTLTTLMMTLRCQ